MLKDTYCNNVNVHDAKRHVSHSQPRIPQFTTSHYRTDPKQRSHPRRLFVPSCACRISDSLYLSREHLDAMSLDTVDIVSTVSRSELAFPTQNRPTEEVINLRLLSLQETQKHTCFWYSSPIRGLQLLHTAPSSFHDKYFALVSTCDDSPLILLLDLSGVLHPRHVAVFTANFISPPTVGVAIWIVRV